MSVIMLFLLFTAACYNYIKLQEQSVNIVNCDNNMYNSCIIIVHNNF